MELIIALLKLLMGMVGFSMVVIVLGFCVFLVFWGYKYTWKQLVTMFLQLTLLTFFFTFIGAILMGGISSVKKWLDKN